MKLLLHTCCGPCFLGVWEELGTHGNVETTLYYDNDNIYPEIEWEKRRNNLRIAANNKKVGLVETEYHGEKYADAINSYVIPAKAGIQKNTRGMDPWFAARDDERGTVPPEIRCPICYRYRLEKVAKYAKENGFDAISTTLFVSPYQQHEVLKNVAADVSAHYGLHCYYTDWRPFFREGQTEAKKLDIYRQKYCGCKYSKQETNK